MPAYVYHHKKKNQKEFDISCHTHARMHTITHN